MDVVEGTERTASQARSYLRRTVAVSALAFALVCGSAQAAPTWLGPGSFGSGPSNNADIAMNARGDAVAVWSSGSGANQQIQWSVRSPRGGFAPAETIPVLNASGYSVVRTVSVAIDNAGNAVAAWVAGRNSDNISILWTSARPPGGSFSTPEGQGGSGREVSEADIDMTPGGNALIAWTQDQVDGAGVCFTARARFRSPSGTLTPATNLSDATCAIAQHRESRDPVVSLNSAGNGVIAYRDRHDDGWHATANLGIGGTFRAARNYSAAGVDGRPAAVFDNGERATVAWKRLSMLEARSATGNGALEPVQLLSTSAAVGRPDLVLDGNRAAFAAWCSAAGLHAAGRAAGAIAWGAMAVPNGSCLASTPDLALRAGNQPAIAFVRGSGQVMFSARAGNAFSSAGAISGSTVDARGPRLAFDGKGNGVSAWGRTGGAAQLQGFDGAPPSITTFNGPGVADYANPATGFLGVAVDDWTPVRLRWLFGDGGVADGSAPAHRYAAVGTYTITLVATDAVGNASSALRSIRIVPPDRDRDTFPEGQDCNDFNAKIRPGAIEIKGNRVDENCDGRKEPFDANRARSTAGWSVLGGRLLLLQLDLTRAVRGTKVQVRCRGRRCPFSRTKTRRVRRAKTNLLKVLKLTPERKRQFRAGQTLEVWIRTSGYLGKVTRYKLKANAIPNSRDLCLAPGSRRPVKRCKPPA